jgi:hypothetical protein
VHVVIDVSTHLLRLEPAKSTNAKLSLEMTKKALSDSVI